MQNIATTQTLTLGPSQLNSVMCFFVDVITARYVFRWCLWWTFTDYSLVLVLPPILDFRLRVGMKITGGVAEFLVRGIGGDILFAYHQDHEHRAHHLW